MQIRCEGQGRPKARLVTLQNLQGSMGQTTNLDEIFRSKLSTQNHCALRVAHVLSPSVDHFHDFMLYMTILFFVTKQPVVMKQAFSCSVALIPESEKRKTHFFRIAATIGIVSAQTFICPASRYSMIRLQGTTVSQTTKSVNSTVKTLINSNQKLKRAWTVSGH